MCYHNNMSERPEGEMEKITPNNFGGEISYRIMAQNWVDDQLVMKIHTEDLMQALDDIKEEYEGKSVSEKPEESSHVGEDEYIIKIS